MNKIKYLYMFTFTMLTLSAGFCQPSTRDFRNLFKEVEFDILNIYTPEIKFGHFLDPSIFSFKGEEIDTSFTELLMEYSTSPSHTWDEYYSSFFACQRYYITTQYEGLLVREHLYNEYRGEEASALHLLIYDNEYENIIDAVQLSLSHDNEYSNASKISCLLDINNDGGVDIIQHSKSFSFNPMRIGAVYLFVDSIMVMLLHNGKFVPVPIEDKEIKWRVKDDFLYTLTPGMSDGTKEILLPYLANKLETKLWSVDKTLDSNTLNINTILIDHYLETGPFFEGQKRECYFVCTGEVSEIGEQYAYDEIKACADITFAIHEVLFFKDAGKQNYQNESYCTAGCLDIMSPGTKVLIFIYEQNGEYVIYNNYWSGSQSIPPIDNYDAPIVRSVKKYLDANQDPMALKDDVSIWAEYGLGSELEKILQTKE